MMAEELSDLQARIAYAQKVRGIARTPQTIGFACCLVGAVLLIWASYKIPGGAFTPFGYTALAVIVVGWCLFAYSVYARARYVRAHPIEPKA